MIRVRFLTDKYMAELILGKAHRTPYGKHYDGHVIAADREVDITYRAPRRDSSVETAYVFANGLSAGKGTMRLPAVEAVAMKHAGITLDYSNKRRIRGALDSNARDVAAVVDSIPPELNARIVGLSEGGRVATRALTLVERKIQAATLVCSAGYIRNNSLSWGQGVNRLSAAAPEIAGMAVRDPIGAFFLGASCLKNCSRRPIGVLGEMHELRNGDEHSTLQGIKADPEAPYLRFYFGAGDKLLQAVRQAAGVEGLPFDEVVTYDGRHCDITTNPGIAREIYSRDEQIFALAPLQQAA